MRPFRVARNAGACNRGQLKPSTTGPLQGSSPAAKEQSSSPPAGELSPGEFRVLRYLPTNLFDAPATIGSNLQRAIDQIASANAWPGGTPGPGTRADISVAPVWIYWVPEEVVMAKTLIDVDEEYLAAAQEVLHTQTKKDTVNAALREVVALAARRRDLQRLESGGLPDMADEEVMRGAWRQ
jgi:Arc/MetJ family transcription regulator